MRKFLNALVLVGLLIASHINAAEFDAAQSSPHSLHRKADEFHIFSGNANPLLANKTSEFLTQEPGKVTVARFNDGEINVQFLENLRERDIFIIQPTCATSEGSVNDHLMELILLTKAAKRASAKSVTAVIPYFGYARQDRKTKPRVTISASDVASLIEFSGVRRVVAIDLHCEQIQGFFRDIPVDNLPASLVFAPHIATLQLGNPIVISPDAGGAERAYKFQSILEDYGVNADYAMIVKKRAEAGVIERMDLVGNVADKDAIIIDDMCDTGGTLIKAGEELIRRGARSVYACFTHPVFSKDAIAKLSASCFTQIITTDTIPLRSICPEKIVVLSVAPMLASVIKRIQNGDSVSDYLAHPSSEKAISSASAISSIDAVVG
jgi:ribose-phosphate pyrophosphokinase